MPTKAKTSNAKSKAKRFRYVLAKEGEFYTLRFGDALVDAVVGLTKRDAMNQAALRLEWFYLELGQLSELVVRTKRGTYSAPRTYGKDPRRTKG